MPFSPRIAKAGLVLLDPKTFEILTVLSLQYNPDSVTRSLQARGSANDLGTDRQRVSGTATQTVNFDAEFDATDQLSVAQPTGVEVESGLHAWLAVLEGLLNPSIDSVVDNDRLADNGVLEVLGTSTPALVLVWSRHRVMPVRLTELSIVEEAFDTRLNPLRARVSFGFTVLGVNELGTQSALGAMAVNHQRGLEQLAGSRSFGSLDDLAQGVTI